MKRDFKFYFLLFFYTFKLSAFTFGGGYVIIPLMKKQFVDKLHWIDEQQMLDYIAIAQSSPGAMAVNASVLLGKGIAGLPGALITILGTITPPFTILTIISFFYKSFSQNEIVQNVLHGMQAGVCAVIIDVVYDMGSKIVKTKMLLPVLIMVFAFCAVFILKINVIWVIFISAFLGIINLKTKGEKK